MSVESRVVKDQCAGRWSISYTRASKVSGLVTATEVIRVVSKINSTDNRAIVEEGNQLNEIEKF